MDWGKIKTIFIITFLVLNLFLIFQFIERNKKELDYITESTIEERLQEEEISFVELPEENINGVYITGESKRFNLQDFKKLKGQKISLEERTKVVSTFKEPIIILTTNMEKYLDRFLLENILYGKEYTYWNWNKEKNRLLFYQTYQDRTLFMNERGMLSVQLDEKNRIVGYEQTYLDPIEKIEVEASSGQPIIPAMDALENLYKRNYLISGDSVTGIELGYSRLVPMSEKIIFFAPAWHITVNGKKDFFVNGIDGQIIDYNLIQQKSQ